MFAQTGITKVILAAAISALVLAAAALVFGLAVYTNETQTAPTTNSHVETKENSDDEQQLPQEESTIFKPSLSGEQQLTGNLSLYILPLEYGKRYESSQIVSKIGGLLGNMEAAHYTHYGVSLQGQHSHERVVLTEQNITEDLKAGGFKVGDVVEMTVIKTPADSVKIHIDPAVKRPDGTPVTMEDISPTWLFGNGVTCCGFSLKDGTDIAAVLFVVDQAYYPIVTQKLDAIKATVSRQVAN